MSNTAISGAAAYTISGAAAYRMSGRGLVAIARGAAATVLLFLSSFGATSWAQEVKASTSLRGAGSTFAAPLYKKWIEEYVFAHPNISIAYDAVGSGEGVKRFIADTVDFAGSDEILTTAEASKTREGSIMVPVTAGMIAIAYNVPGVNTEIKLPRDVYVDIFAGRFGSGTTRVSRRRTPQSAFPISTSQSLPVRTAAERQRPSHTISPQSQLGARPEWVSAS